MSNPLENIASIMKPIDTGAMPDGPSMVSFALDVLRNCEIGMRLVTVSEMEGWNISVIKTPMETTVITDPGHLTVGICQIPPTPPGRFVLLLAGILRESEQDFQGMTQAGMNDPAAEQVRIAMKKQGDKVAYICAIAHQLNEISEFKNYRLIDEVRNMGYSQSMDTFLTNL